MHPGRVPPAEERLAGVLLAADEILCGSEGFLVDGLHSLLGQRSGVLDRLASFAVRLGTDHAPRSEFLQEGRILGIVEIFGLFRRVEVIETAEVFVEAVHCRQMFVAITEMILTELAGGVALFLQQGGDSRIAGLPTFLCPGQADLRHAGADRDGPTDKSGTPGSAALLAVIVGKGYALARDPVDVRRLVTHHSAVVVADIPGADIITPDHQNVRRTTGSPGRLLLGLSRLNCSA